MENNATGGSEQPEFKEAVRLSGAQNETLNSLDRVFQGFAADHSAEELYLPALTRYETLERCGYIRSFPQHLMAVSVVPEDQCAAVAGGARIDSGKLGSSGMFLAPAACIGIYPSLENRTDIERAVITVRSRVYRFEGGKWDGSTRLCEFTMREIVVFGEEAFVGETIGALMEKTLAFARTLNSQAHIAGAADPFFPAAENVVKSKLQKANALKTEIIIPIDGRPVAVSSFNRHGGHFTGPFNIGRRGAIVSGCVGYGLERWLAARSGA